MHEHDQELLGQRPTRDRVSDVNDSTMATMSRAATEGRAAEMGPAALLHLQRHIGNAAVARMLTSSDSSVQRTAAESDEESPVHAVVASSGSTLDPTVRRPMERALGSDFGDVQVHTDDSAARSAQSVGAHAYTVGNHVVFGAGRYQPETAEGQRTIAHELTHVVQQRKGPVDGSPAGGGIRVSDPTDPFEREAERVAAGLHIEGPPASSSPRAESAPVQTQRDAVEGDAVMQRQATEQDVEQESVQAAAEVPKESLDEETDENEPGATVAQRDASDEQDEEQPPADG